MRGVMTWVLLLTLAAGAFARPNMQSVTSDEREANAIGRQILVYRTVLGLQLTDEQKKGLQTILADQVKDLTAVSDAQTKAQPDLEAALTDLRTAVLANKPVPEAAIAAVIKAQSPYVNLDEKLKAAAPTRIAAVWKLLTTVQGARLHRANAFGVESDEAFVAGFAAKLNAKNKRPADFLPRLYKGLGLQGAEVDRAIKVGQPIFDAWQALTVEDAYAKRVEYLTKLVTLPDTGILEEKPDGAAARSIADQVLTQTALHLLDPATPLPAFVPIDTDKVRDLSADIRVMSQVNTLDLTAEQIQKLQELLKKTTPDYAAVETKRAALATQALPTLRAMRDDAAKGVAATDDQRKALAEIETGRQPLVKEESRLDDANALELAKLLTDVQLLQANTFAPDNAPVQAVVRPARAGQEKDPHGFLRALDALRKVKDDQLAAETDKITAKLKENLLHRGYSEKEVAPVLTALPDVAKQARALDEAAFKAKAEELVKPLALPDKAPSGKELDRRLVTYLLAPNLSALLAK